MSSHPIVHIEIPASDPQSLSKFYASVFGWNLQFDESYNYLQFQSEGGPGGAFVNVNEVMPGQPPYKIGQPLIYIDADDIDATLTNVKAHGGKVLMPKTEIPHVGWFAIFVDPTGNTLALFTSMRN